MAHVLHCLPRQKDVDTHNTHSYILGITFIYLFIYYYYYYYYCKYYYIALLHEDQFFFLLKFSENEDYLKLYDEESTSETECEAQTFESIQLQLDIIKSLREQPWPMARKLQTLR